MVKGPAVHLALHGQAPPRRHPGHGGRNRAVAAPWGAYIGAASALVRADPAWTGANRIPRGAAGIEEAKAHREALASASARHGFTLAAL